MGTVIPIPPETSTRDVPHFEGCAIESWPVALRSLPRTEELSAMVERHCRFYGVRKKDRAHVEDDLLLQFHFGGGMVPIAMTPAGPLVLARRIPEIEAAESRTAFERLVRQQQNLGHTVCFESVPAWENAATEMI